MLNEQDPSKKYLKSLTQLYKSGDFFETISRTNKLLKEFPLSAKLYDILGVSYYAQKNTTAAINSFQSAIRNDPNFVNPHYNLGNVFYILNEQDKAIKAFRNALKIDENHTHAIVNLGNVFRDKGEISNSIVFYRKALEIDEKFVNAYHNLGVALWNQNNLNESIASFKKCLELNPLLVDAHVNIGIVYIDLGEFDLAILSLSKAIAIDPIFQDAFFHLGIIFFRNGKLDLAIHNFRAVIKIDPDFKNAHYNLGVCLNETGESEAAMRSFRRTLKIDPYFPQAKHLLSALEGKTTKTAPAEYVKHLFDNYSTTFEHSLVNTLGYQTPTLISDMLVKDRSDNFFGTILDLGCGTGLAGEALRKFCRNLHGVDISKKMLRYSEKKNIYDRLEEIEIIEYLTTAELNYDCFISSDVFNYIGDLSEIFHLIKTRNKKQGEILFSTEHTNKDTFFLEKTGRYSHSSNYINGLCQKFQFEVLHYKLVSLRLENKKKVMGGLYHLKFDI